MMMAGVAASRSTCTRRQVGAVIVLNSHIISTGYNGAPKGLPHCGEVGCLRTLLNVPSGERHEICRGSHAELNAIVQAASVGTATAGGTIYCTHEPCSFCTKAIINAGIQRVVYVHPYPDELARQMRADGAVQTDRLSEEVFASVVPLLERLFRPAEK